MSTPTLARPSTPYRDDLCRMVEVPLLRAEDDESGDGLTIEGYGAVVGSVTHIDSWEGEFDEIIAPGAFRKTLRERTPKMQFDHGRHPLLGSLPLGVWEVAEEDSRGLHLVGRLADNWLVQPFREAIAQGGVEGMSFRFSVVREEWTDKDGKKIKDEELSKLLWYGAGDRGPILRTLKELSVSEAGPVVWPAYEETSVGVRSSVITIDLAALRTPQARHDLARAVALADSAATHPGLDSTLVTHAEFVEARRKLVAERNRPPVQTPAGTAPVAVRPEPRSTATPAADEHAREAPPVTADAAAGEHSSSTTPRPVRTAAAMRSAVSQRKQIVDQLMNRK